MRAVTAELREIVEAVEFRPAGSIAVSGETVELRAGDDGPGDPSSPLANVLYQRLYCRPQQERSGLGADNRAQRVFVENLSRANGGSGSWEPGWVVEALEDDGTLVVHRQRDGLTLWAQPEQFRPALGPVGVGSAGRLHVGKELREMLPGYYTILGEADQVDEDAGAPVAIVRFYWHLTAAGAALWIAELTQRFNGAGLAFQAKVHSNPGAYVRADAGVLYVAYRDLARTMALLVDLHGAVSSQLRPATPMFTKPLARGLAVAEDPGDGRSFGQHRCRLVAEGLMRALESGRTGFDDAATAVASRFAEARVSVVQPWLNPGSQDCYAWPPAGSRR